MGQSGGNGTPLPLAATKTTVLGKCPNLIAHCTCAMYEDGSPRRPGWFTIKVQGGQWCVQVKDPDAEASVTILATTLDEALAATEAGLSADSLPWQPDDFLRDRGSKKKKS